MDPFDVQPIVTDHRPAQLRLSARERRERRVRNRAQQATGPRQREPRVKIPLRVRSAALTSVEALQMVSTLARSFYATAKDPTEKQSQRNFASRSLGIMLDKWTIVSGRPTQILGFADAAQLRGPALEMAERLASLKRA